MRNNLLKYMLQDGMYEMTFSIFIILFVVTSRGIDYGHTGLLSQDKLPDLALYFIYLISAGLIIYLVRKKFIYSLLGMAKPTKDWMYKTFLTFSIPIISFGFLLWLVGVGALMKIFTSEYPFYSNNTYNWMSFVRLIGYTLMLAIPFLLIYTKTKLTRFAIYSLTALICASLLVLGEISFRIDLLLLIVSIVVLIAGLASFVNLIKGSNNVKSSK